MPSLFKKIVLIIISVSFLFAFAANPPQKSSPKKEQAKYLKALKIDDFDDAELKVSPAWWVFDKMDFVFTEAKRTENGNYYLTISGQPDNYYLGGMGTYLGVDASDYNYLVLSIYGNGAESGILKLQLYDDDNNNYQLEQDSTFQVLYDDVLEYEQIIDWEGWQTIEIPLSRFVDVNQGIGDDIWNPNQKDGSGGLLHFQMVVLSPTQTGKVKFGIDNIKLVKKSE